MFRQIENTLNNYNQLFNNNNLIEFILDIQNMKHISNWNTCIHNSQNTKYQPNFEVENRVFRIWKNSEILSKIEIVSLDSFRA